MRFPKELMAKLSASRKDEIDDAERQIDRQLDEKFEGGFLDVRFEGVMKDWLIAAIRSIYNSYWSVDLHRHGEDEDGCQFSMIKFTALEEK